MVNVVDNEEPIGRRRRSKVVGYYHLVWSTKGRQAYLTPDFERQVHRLISGICERLDCTLLAIGGMPDHIHVIVCAPGKFSPSDLARNFKGPTSALINDIRPKFSDLFRWQEGYGCFTLSQSHVLKAIEYVRNQKQHHAEKSSLWPGWEETNEEFPVIDP
jgi:putative transposase